MSNPIAITITGGAREKLRKLADPSAVAQALAREMDNQNGLTVAWIMRQYLSFPKSDPPHPDGLRVVSNRLRGSLRASKAAFDSNGITSAIGSNVAYAAIHEFGGTIHRKARTTTVRLATDRAGNLIRQEGNASLAVFARRNRKRAREVKASVGAYDIVMPARRPVRRGIADRASQYTEAFSATVLNLS